jgi:hypothetical protein
MPTKLTNLHRAASAQNALATFVAENWSDTKVNRLQAEDLSDAISDLISDILHLALLKKLDPEHVLAQARANFDAELTEEL